MITIRDIAREAHVSVATVSRVLNNPQLVNEERRLRVLQVIGERNYYPNEVARGLITKLTKSIGLFVTDVENTFFTALIKGVTDGLYASGIDIYLCITGNDLDREMRYMDNMLKKRTDCALLIGTRPRDAKNNEMILAMAEAMPVVMVFEYMPDVGIYSIRTDEINWARQAVKYLIGLGHRRIGFINGDRNHSTYYQKQLGYEVALAEEGIGRQDRYCVRVSPYEAGGYEGAQALLSLTDPPTALFTASDQIALGAYRAIAAKGLRVPGDVSVIGFGGIPFAAEMSPSLTTVDQHPYEVGENAAKLVLKILHGKEIREKQTILQADLVLRDSCAPPKTET